MARDPLEWIDAALADWQQQGLRRQLATHDGAQGPTVSIDGRPLINFGSNDYLGLAGDPRLADAAAEALKHAGLGAGASPLVTGHEATHQKLEAQLAEFEGTQAALLFPSGFAANAGTIAALVGPEDAVFSDAKNHASLIDGCRLSRARVHVYPHCDVGALGALLREAGPSRRRLIVTDSLFSMDGDLAPLVELVDLAERHDAMLLVDEAHATGVFGEHGRGVCEHLGVEDRVPIRVGTLSKALGAAGGFVVGSRRLIDWLLNRARPYVFSTAQPPVIAAAASAALEIVRSEPQRRRDLLARAEMLREKLRGQGLNVGRAESQIIPIFIGDAGRTMRLAAALRERGLFLPGIRPPTVPDGESLLRLSLCYGHTDEMVATLLSALENAG